MFMSKIATLGALAALATSVSAHGTVQGVSVGGVYTVGYLLEYAYMTDPPESVGWTEDALDNGYVSDYGSADIICHKNATNAQLSVNITAGDDMVLYWTAWPDSHRGPVTSYLASCGDSCATVDKTTLEFVKFDEAGLITPGSDQVWASDELISNNNSWTVTIPSNLAAGNWVLRHEILALHGAGSENGAQAYPFCINLAVSGTGTESPAGTPGEDLYTATDPGVLLNIYTDLENYTIPGPPIPAVFASSGSSNSISSSSSIASVATSTSAASSVATVASTSATPTSVAVASTSTSASSVSTQVVAATSTSAVTSAAVTSSATSASATAAASSIVSAIASLTTDLPSSVLTSAAPTATATTSSGSTVSTAGLTVAELLDLLKQILMQLFESSTSSTKVRRHARSF